MVLQVRPTPSYLSRSYGTCYHMCPGVRVAQISRLQLEALHTDRRNSVHWPSVQVIGCSQGIPCRQLAAVWASGEVYLLHSGRQDKAIGCSLGGRCQVKAVGCSQGVRCRLLVAVWASHAGYTVPSAYVSAGLESRSPVNIDRGRGRPRHSR